MRSRGDVLVEPNFAELMHDAETSMTAGFVLDTLARIHSSDTEHKSHIVAIRNALPEGTVVTFRPAPDSDLTVVRDSFRGLTSCKLYGEQAIAFTKTDRPVNPTLTPYLPKSSYMPKELGSQRGEARMGIFFDRKERLVTAEFRAPQPKQSISRKKNAAARIRLPFLDDGTPNFRLGVILPDHSRD